MKRARKAGLRGEMRIERNLRQRQLACRQFRHRILQPHAADIAVGRNAQGELELAHKMKLAVTSDSGELCKCDVVRDLYRDIVENAAKPTTIETMRRGFGWRACATIAMLLKEPTREHQRSYF